MKKLLLALFALGSVTTLSACGQDVKFTGSALTQSGQPLSGARVVLEQRGAIVDTATTDKHGRYAVSHFESRGFGCGASLADDGGYTLTIKASDDRLAAFARLRSYAGLTDINAVMLADAPSVAIEDKALSVTSLAQQVLVDDGLLWDGSALPVESLATGGTHVVRAAITGGVFFVASPGTEITVPEASDRIALGNDTPPELSDGKFATYQNFDQVSLKVSLGHASRVNQVIFAGIESEHSTLGLAKPQLTVLGGGKELPVDAAQCEHHGSSFYCFGDWDAVDSLELRLNDDTGAGQTYFHASEVIVF